MSTFHDDTEQRFELIMLLCSNNADDVHMMFEPLRRAAIGPDGLSDAGDVADISLLHQLVGEDSQDSLK
jgi:hypothetical protein